MIASTAHGDFVLTADPVLPAAANRFVLFMLGDKGDGVYATPPTSVTINPLSPLALTRYTTAGVADECAQIWGVPIPNTWAAGGGSGEYRITVSGQAVFQRWFWAVFSGVSRDPVVDADSQRIGISTNDYSSLTVDCVDGGWVHDIVWANPAKTPFTGQTQVYNVNARGGVSYKSGLTKGTTTMRWDWTDSACAHAVVSLRPHKSGSGIIMF